MVRKCIILSVLMAVISLLGSNGLVYGQGTGDILFNEYVRNESTYLAQKIQFPRSDFDNPFTLGQQLSELVGDLDYTSAVVVQQWIGGSQSEKFDDPHKVLEMDPVFLCFNREGSSLKFKYPDITATVFLNYREDSTGLERTMAVHFNPRGFPQKVVYTRTSIMISPVGEDDLESFNSESSAVSASYLTAFDVAPDQEYRERFSKVLSSTVHKDSTGGEFDMTELSCKKGLDESDDLENAIYYGQRLMQDNSLFDGSMAWAPAFEKLKKSIRPDTAVVDELFHKICAGMGACNWAMGNFDSADYYFGLLEDVTDSLEFDLAKYEESRLQAPALMDGPGTYLGQVLPILYDIPEESLLEAVVERNGEIVRITGKDKLWNYNLKDLCISGVSKMVLSYTRSVEVMGLEEIMDESVLCNFNNLVITVEKVAETLFRVNIMHPKFKRFDYKNHPDSDLNTPDMASFIMSSLPVEPLDAGRKSLGLKKIEDKLTYIGTLKKSNCSMEAAIAALQLCREIDRLPQKQLQKEKGQILHLTALYIAGTLLADLDMPYKAISYLRRSTRIIPTYTTMSEYIAILTNEMDPRAFHIVLEEIRDMQSYQGQKSPEQAEYASFLNRRLAYMLIDYKAYNQAEELLQALLNDPLSAEFARHELEYIKQIRESE